MIRDYLYISTAKVDSVLAQAKARGPRPRVTRLDFKVASVEFEPPDGPEPAEQRVLRAERELAADGLVVDAEDAREGQYFYAAMSMRWGEVQSDWGETGPQPTAMFIGRQPGRQVALYGSLRHVRGFGDVEGATTGSYGFVLWDIVADRLNATEPGLVDREFPGIASGRRLLDRWSPRERLREAHATLTIVHERMVHEGLFEFLAVVHKRFDCSRDVEYVESGRWVLGSPVYVAWSVPGDSPTP